jgi:DNA-binding SARP family transcriptional activator
MTVLGRVVRGVVALAALVALLGGVPWALWHYIGWPLPHALPTWEQVSQALSGNQLPEELLFKSLAVVCWAAWAALAVSVAAEAQAAIRGVTARQLPLTGPMQILARHLVAAVLVLLPPMGPRLVLAVPPSPVIAAVTTMPITGPSMPLHGPADDSSLVLASPARAGQPSVTASATAAEAELPRHRVAPKETLWGLAERYLGDPLRWHEIFDLNQGRPQPNGEQLTDEDLIRPGWILLLPADARVPGAVPPQAPPAGGRSNGDVRHDSAGGHHGEPAAPPTSRAPSPSTSAVPVTHDRHPHHRIIELPLGGVVGLSLAAAITAAPAAARLHRRRRWQPAEPAPGMAHGDPLVTETIRRLDQAMRAASQPDDDWADDERGQQSDTGMERPRPVPTTSPAFGVVTVGHRDGEELALDLPAVGGLALTGPGALTAARALVVTALARNREAPVEVVVAGADLGHDLLPDVGAVPGLAIVADLDAALRRLEVEALYRTRLLDDSQTSTIAEFRSDHATEPLPLLLLVAGTPPSILAGRLAALLDSDERLGIGMVILGEAQGVNDLAISANGEVTATSAASGPLGELCDAHMMMLHPDQGQEALALVAASHGEPPVPVAADTPPAAATAPAGVTTDRATSEAPPAPMPTRAGTESRPIVVRLLGSIRIEANGQEIRKGLRSKAREFLALLLVHPEGIDAEVAVEALWPDVPPPRGVERFQTTLSNLRSTLHVAAGLDDNQVVVPYAAGRYQLQTDLVDCDLWRFQTALAAAGGATEPTAKSAALQEAITAYGGTLAEGERYGWVEEFREGLRRRALDAAARLADLHERQGETSAAIEVLEQAITWDPYAEELYRRLMRLNAALHRVDEIRRVFQRLTARLEELDADPDDTTRRLFFELAGSTSKRRRL